MLEQTLGHYKILAKLGEGGMGVVYKALDLKLDRPVALKFLPARLTADDSLRSRFLKEAKAASGLNHPNVCVIHDYDQSGTQDFIVMEYVEGKTLKERIREESLTPLQAVDIAIQMALALKAAHDKGITHRDIKSDNVMVTHEGHVKITDFGIVKLKGIAQTGTVLGTPAYMSPEILQGRQADARSDIWSCGIVLYEMLTGELPFTADNEAAWAFVIASHEPAPPSIFDRRIPHRLDGAVRRMLEKDPAQRYPGMEAVIKGLQEIRSKMGTPGRADKRKSIAVLPFKNISPDKDDDYFSDGLAEELIANLSRLKDVRVVSRTSSMQYKGTNKDIKMIGSELGARFILEGSVRKFQDNLRITAQLVNVDTDVQLWAETYKGRLADIFDIQEQVAKQIVDALMLQLTPTDKVVLSKRSTHDPEAFDLNLRARGFLYRLTKRNVQFAIELFGKAVELDPRYAGAHAGLAEAWASLYQYFERNEAHLDKAIESGLKALMYDASLSEAYASLSLAYFWKRSLEEALTASRKAIELDPNNFTAYWILGRIYYTTDREREAVELQQRVIELNPDFYTAYGDLRILYERLGEKKKLEETLQASLKVLPRYLSQHPDDARAHIFYAMQLRLAGRTEEAQAEGAKALELSPGDPLMLYNAACFYALLGDGRRALATLKEAIAAGFQHYEWIKRDPDLNPIRSSPEFAALIG